VKSPFHHQPENFSEKSFYDLALKQNVFVMEAMWTRFNRLLEQVIEWVEEGEIRRFELAFKQV